MKEPNIQNYMCLKNGTSMSSGFDPFHRSSLPSLAPADQVPFSRHRCTGRWWLTVPPGMMRWPPKMGPIIGGWIQCGFYFHHKLCFGTGRCSCGYIYITPYSFRGCIPAYGGYNLLLCPFIASTATPAARQRLCHVCCLEIFIQREQVGN